MSILRTLWSSESTYNLIYPRPPQLQCDLHLCSETQRHYWKRSCWPGRQTCHQEPSYPPNILPTCYDHSSFIHSFIKRLWTQQWKTIPPKANKLADIKSSPLPWVTANQPSCRAEIALRRLRIGHTRLTHTHLISDLFPLSCHFCKTNVFISVDHLFSCRDSHLVPYDRKLALRNRYEAISRTLLPPPHGYPAPDLTPLPMQIIRRVSACKNEMKKKRRVILRQNPKYALQRAPKTLIKPRI